ncbi:uncharacterized protein LOC129964187 [Argiope bruennichi]|uniref:Uncharacterized protein n=1 Tax=Argiope bruennichi TaxID=94029 RepID=A0A8T0EU98_ARGBR|nr:uncharacterized protein LOC129964187 [Argiope bruennichi]KAF8781833.1 hypothetical protein HNY73_012187 [Argiope bruennichi]
MEHLDLNQNLTQKNGNITKEFNSILTQHEDLRRATLLKHRKVSTQLKLDMVQRQLSCLRRSHTDSETARQFYRSQMAELSSELQDLDCSLNKVERNAFYARKRLLRQYGMEYVSQSTGAISLSSSHPAIFSSNDNLQRSTSRSSLISKVSHLVSSSPSHKSKKRHFFGELRAVASLSSLNTKSGSQANGEEDSSPPSKDSKPWKAPLKFLGNLVDSRIRRKLWGSDRTKSVDHIMDDKKESSDIESKDCNGFGITDDTSSSSTSSSESNDEEEVEEIEEWRPKRGSRSAWKAPVARKISNNQKAQIDPAILAEIEEFEKMAAQYIKQHS